MFEFFIRYFLHFKIVIWDTKSTKYMEDMVLIMLRRLKGTSNYALYFVLSDKDCDAMGTIMKCTQVGEIAQESVLKVTMLECLEHGHH